ncbi:MAG: GIY-YIG nuclease family protein [Cetobacterium sp.]
MSNKGFVYALINPGMPGYVKIGKTKRDVEKRVNELSSSTGVPHKYACAYSIEVSDCHIVEKKLHEDFSQYRVNNNREFFEIDLKNVIDKMLEYQNNFSFKEDSNNLKMALNYYFGSNGYLEDLFKARKYFEYALEDGDYEACLYLARMQSLGYAGFNSSRSEAINILNIAVKNGLDKAYADLGSMYFFNEDYENSIISWNNYILSENINEKDKAFNYFYYIKCCYYMDVEVEHTYKLQKLRNEIMKTYLRTTMDDDFEIDRKFYDYLNYYLGYFTKDEVNFLRGQVYSEEHNSEDEEYEDDFEEEIEEEVTTFDIGENYYYGFEDYIKDERIALGYFRQAIKERDYRAYYHIGNMYYYEEGGLKESTIKAIENFVLGIEQGINDCYAELAKIYTSEQNYENAYKSWINYMSKDNYSFDWSISGNYLDYIYYCYRENKKVDFIEKIGFKKQEIYTTLQNRIKSDSHLKIDVDFFEFLKESIGKTEIQELIENYYPNIANGKRYNKNGYDYDENSFNRDGIHRITETKYNPEGYDKDGYDKFGFNIRGVNKVTQKKYALDGYDRFGYNINGYDKNNFSRDGIHRITETKYSPEGYDKDGYDRFGYNINGYDKNNFSRDGIHKTTQIKYNPEDYDRENKIINNKQDDKILKTNSFFTLIKKIFVK